MIYSCPVKEKAKTNPDRAMSLWAGRVLTVPMSQLDLIYRFEKLNLNILKFQPPVIHEHAAAQHFEKTVCLSHSASPLSDLLQDEPADTDQSHGSAYGTTTNSRGLRQTGAAADGFSLSNALFILFLFL